MELDHGGVDVGHGAGEQKVGEHFYLAALDVHLHDDGGRTRTSLGVGPPSFGMIWQDPTSHSTTAGREGGLLALSDSLVIRHRAGRPSRCHIHWRSRSTCSLSTFYRLVHV